MRRSDTDARERGVRAAHRLRVVVGRGLAGFTLVEIMVVVVIIGLLAAIALPAFQRVRERSYASRYVNDFRQFDSAFQRYATENGQWPPQTLPGVVPTGMAGYLPANYTAPTPMGGSYQWFNSGETVIALMGSQATDAVMQRVDAALDDGNLSSGTFFKIGTAGYGYRLQ